MSKIERRAILTGMAALPLAAPGLARGQTAATPARPVQVGLLSDMSGPFRDVGGPGNRVAADRSADTGFSPEWIFAIVVAGLSAASALIFLAVSPLGALPVIGSRDWRCRAGDPDAGDADARHTWNPNAGHADAGNAHPGRTEYADAGHARVAAAGLAAAARALSGSPKKGGPRLSPG